VNNVVDLRQFGNCKFRTHIVVKVGSRELTNFTDRNAGAEVIRSILIPVDGSAHANAAIRWGSDLAVKYEATLTLLHVVTSTSRQQFPEERIAQAQAERLDVGGVSKTAAAWTEIIRSAEERARSLGASRVETLVEAGEPADTILGHAKNLPVDLIVMGRRGWSVLPEIVLGSVSSRVLHAAHCACLLVQQPRKA
jgi:nucleotide-binding universal stress UspA family protein